MAHPESMQAYVSVQQFQKAVRKTKLPDLSYSQSVHIASGRYSLECFSVHANSIGIIVANCI